MMINYTMFNQSSTLKHITFKKSSTNHYWIFSSFDKTLIEYMEVRTSHWDSLEKVI